MDLEILIIELSKYNSLEEKEKFLLNNNRIPHIPKHSSLSKILSREEPNRFIKVGSFFYYQKEEDTDKKYKNICRLNGEFIFENYPILFEFYDEYINGYSYGEEDIQKIIRKC